MRKAFAALLILFALAPAAPAAAFDGASEARYQSLLAAAKAAGDQPVDWGVLRLAYADSAEFDLTGGRTDAARKAMFAAVNAGDAKTALTQARLILAQDYVDIDAHVVADLASKKPGDTATAAREHAIVLGLLRSVRIGDGSSPAMALKVITVGEEYAVTRAFDMTVTGQALVQDGGHSYDRLSVTDPDGKPLTIYFLIDNIVAAEGAAVK
ncbi:MAG TPA: hypothetical protein VE309_07845 [Caulobacteraceae bacterium]|nr:hypothetical protein [Caulobacteraceae bacterium]